MTVKHNGRAYAVRLVGEDSLALARTAEGVWRHARPVFVLTRISRRPA